MFNFIRSLFAEKPTAPVTKAIAFIDGDQVSKKAFRAYDMYLKANNIETHFIALNSHSDRSLYGLPIEVKKRPEIQTTVLEGMRTGKEVVDKYIAARIQQAVSQGYNSITVISRDYDFVDIFKMMVVLNPNADNLEFKLLAPHALGVMAKCPSKMANIEITRV